MSWFALGVMWVLTVLGAFTIGVVVLPIAVGGTIFSPPVVTQATASRD